MKAEMISYRCRRDEWETARMLLGLEPPIGLPEPAMNEETCQNAYHSLCKAGLLTPIGDEAVIDRLFAFLLTQSSKADIALILRSGTCRIGLHRAPELILLSEWSPNKCEWFPLPNPNAAREPLFALLKHCGLPIDMELMLSWNIIRTSSAEILETAYEALEQMYNEFCVRSINPN